MRELQNIVERAVVVANAPIIQMDEAMLRSDSPASMFFKLGS